MKKKLNRLSRAYATALRKHLKQGLRASLVPARKLGRHAAAIGLETLDVAKIHETALATLEASSSTDGIIKRAELFFAEAQRLSSTGSFLWRVSTGEITWSDCLKRR